ncbi:MAG: SHOCT domain-containing protein [Thermomicrobiales bacterium]
MGWQLGKGKPVNQTFSVAASPDTVMRDLMNIGSTADGYSVSSMTPTALVLTRSYLPGWALGATLISFWILLGLLFLLVREKENLTISLRQTATGGTEVQISGFATEALQALISMFAANHQALPALPSPAPDAPVSPIAPATAPPAPPTPEATTLDRLQTLKRLHESGELSEDEYAEQRQRLIALL